MKKRIRFVQAQLNGRGLNAGAEDGILGPKTLKALTKVDGIADHWSGKRKVVAFIQILADEKGIETGPIDGYWGPQTEFAFDSLQVRLEHDQEPEIWRPEELPDENPNDWPKQTPETELVKYYGEVNTNQTEYSCRIRISYPGKPLQLLTVSHVMKKFMIV